MKFNEIQIYIQYITLQLEGSKEQTHQLLLYRMIDLEDHQGSSQISTAYGLSPSLQSIRSSCAVARNSAVALDKACQKIRHWFLEVKIWKFLSKTV